MGYVFGLLLRNPTAGKFIIFGFAGIFIYEPVKDAGLLAAGVFVVGIIIHHIGFDAIADVLRSFKIVEFFWGRSKSPMPRAPQDEFSPNRDSESEEETLRKYKEYIEGLRKKKSVPPKDKRQPEKRKTPEKPTRKPKIDSKNPWFLLYISKTMRNIIIIGIKNKNGNLSLWFLVFFFMISNMMLFDISITFIIFL